MPDEPDEVPTTEEDFRTTYRLRGSPQPPKAEEILAAIATRYPDGSTVSLVAICATAGVSETTAI